MPDLLLFEEDGIKQFNSYTLDVGTYAHIPLDFEVKKGWQKFTVFYNDYSWTVSAEDVTTQPYNGTPLFEISPEQNSTDIGYTASAKKYDVQYDGFEVIPQQYSWSGPWFAFKFTVTNTGDESLDMNLVGYNMRAYRNKCLMDGASYTVNNNLNGYINIFDLDEVKPGMTSQVYVAFETSETTGNFMMAFDDGYLFGNVIDYFYANN